MKSIQAHRGTESPHGLQKESEPLFYALWVMFQPLRLNRELGQKESKLQHDYPNATHSSR